MRNPIKRRDVLAFSAAALLMPRTAKSQARSPVQKISAPPDSITVWTENAAVSLERNGERWRKQQIEVGFALQADSAAITLRSASEAVVRVHIRWQLSLAGGLRFLGDDWERSYGTLAWREMEPERVMPWYCLLFDGASTSALGVKTGAAALCFWQVDPEGVSLWLDVRNGGRGVKLGNRELAVASIVTGFYADTKPFPAAQRFCRAMCRKPRMPAKPVYGGNNWYYAYGHSSADDIRADSERISSLAESSQNRPFMVIDDGWEPHSVAGPWTSGNARFPDMTKLAANMKGLGVQPGLWLRPLYTKEEITESWRLQSPNAAREYASRQCYTIDPTVPEALEKVKQDFRTAAAWGYGLLKHDFSTYDLLGRWGFNMGAAVTDSGWGFSDGSLTNAEIILKLYGVLREAVGDCMLLGCNTVGHLGAGIFELQRTGDDTSGREWDRTRKMGVNTLAFRMPQHGAFFAVDADCVGLTKQIPWALNRQWLHLVAYSGTPLFVSLAPDAFGAEQRAALKDAFVAAAKAGPVAEPKDWLENNEPQKWFLSGQTKVTSYDWFGTQGVSPFAG